MYMLVPMYTRPFAFQGQQGISFLHVMYFSNQSLESNKVIID